MDWSLIFKFVGLLICLYLVITLAVRNAIKAAYKSITGLFTYSEIRRFLINNDIDPDDIIEFEEDDKPERKTYIKKK